MVPLKFKGTSIALWSVLGSQAHPTSLWDPQLYSLPRRSAGTPLPAVAETGGGVNFENDPCHNVMNQEAGILHQLFMQIFGCSLS